MHNCVLWLQAVGTTEATHQTICDDNVITPEKTTSNQNNIVDFYEQISTYLLHEPSLTAWLQQKPD